jgi:hypothetical protein
LRDYSVQLFGIVREQRFGMPSEAAGPTKTEAQAEAKAEAQTQTKEEGPTPLRLVRSSAKHSAGTSGLLSPLAVVRARLGQTITTRPSRNPRRRFA